MTFTCHLLTHQRTTSVVDKHVAAMMKHGMNVLRQATQFLNTEQTPVIALDALLYALAKEQGARNLWWKQVYYPVREPTHINGCVEHL